MYQSNYGIHELFDKGVDQYNYTANHGWSKYKSVTTASMDILKRGVDQYILVSVGGSRIPE